MDDLDGFLSPARWAGHPATLVAETASTSDDARRAADAGAPHGALFVADAQTAGRGRLGRRWSSPPGANLYASIVLRPRAPARALSMLPLAVGLAVAECVDRFAGPARAAIKWPNDLRVDGKKLAGVLVEGALRGEHFQHVVVGIGLNVRGAQAPDEVAAIATTLQAVCGHAPPRREVLAALMEALERQVDALEAGRAAQVLAAVSARCETLGRALSVRGRPARAVALREDGGLVVRYDDGAEETVHGSEAVSHPA